MEDYDEIEETSSFHNLRPDGEQTYYMDNWLTIENEKGIQTLKVSQWLTDDPVSFDKVRKELNLNVGYEVFNVLVSKLRANYPEYFRDALGLNTRIKFKGYDLPVKAIVPYKDHPVEFYKWWYPNQQVVNMSLAEKIRLFDQVYKHDQKVLKKEHRKIIGKK